ncbi:MAG: SpoIIE family protein phosphatase, partial [Rhodospirillaceae bacterium]|nr:SpoIIE family protein phosphatase [Rhodospirillaceae bacterium]
QALHLYIGLPLSVGYAFCSLIIIPVVFYGMTAISRLQLITQPVWLILMILPFAVVLMKDPNVLDRVFNLSGDISGDSTFSWQFFGLSLGISLSLIAQIGEQADYLRFMPDKTKENRIKWWLAVILAGPGWTILGFAKQIGGILLAVLVVVGGASFVEAKEPIHMYNAAYRYVFENPDVALLISFVFVMVSQIKINVTNAYAGSLAWSNFFSRTTHTHLGRVVWVIFNITIALLLMLMGVFDVLEKILGLYSNVAIAWITAIFADLIINKPLGLSPPTIEFKRAYLFNINPVGCVSTLVASIFSIIAFSGALGPDLQAFSSMIALVTALILTPLICYLTGGKYYIARPADGFEDGMHHCGVCQASYSAPDMAICPMHASSICSLCCSVEGRCHDMCKTAEEFKVTDKVIRWVGKISNDYIHPEKIYRITQFLILFVSLISISSFLLWTSYVVQVVNVSAHLIETIQNTYLNIFYLLALILFIGTWLIVLMQETRDYVENERKKAETKLGAKEYQLRMAMENMPGAMIVVDPDLRVAAVNDTYKDFFGDPDGLIAPGASMIDILKSEIARGLLSGSGSPEDVLEDRIRSLRQDSIATYEDRSPDGRYIQLSRTLAPSGHTVSVAIDITERKKAEKIIADAMALINGSINYASRIQRSVLPDPTVLVEAFDDHAVIWEPKDVVGGDVYLYRKCDAGHLLMLVDCTGHGVPGAFMTMIVTGALDQALIEVPSGDPAALLKRINRLVKTVLRQDVDGSESDDGFECGICLINDLEKKITYVGARFELWCVKGQELLEIKGDKVSVGYRRTTMDFSFTSHTLPIDRDTSYYMTSDGLVDQVGGEKRRAFGKRRLKGVILDGSRMSMAKQAAHILRAFEDYQHHEERRDDISLVGFKPKI